MAHFSKVDSNGYVIKVVVVKNSTITDGNGVEQEGLGQEFLRDLYNDGSANWVQCSYNTSKGEHGLGGTPFRKNYPGAGWKYDSAKDAFIEPQPFPSWILDENTCTYNPPVAEPETNDDGLVNENGDPVPDIYDWDEGAGAWVKQVS